MESNSKEILLNFITKGGIPYVSGDNGRLRIKFKLIGDKWIFEPTPTKPRISIAQPINENSEKILKRLNENEEHTGDTLIIENDPANFQEEFEYIDPGSPKISDPILKGGKRRTRRMRRSRRSRRTRNKRYRKRY